MIASEKALPAGGPPFLFHLKLVAKIALAVGALACTGLVALLLWFADTQAASYSQAVGSYARTEARLDIILPVFGLGMAAVAGVTTWLVALYSSFRVAGPLYRFARNLELEIAQGPTPPLPTRRADLLHSEAAALRAAAAALEQHHAALRAAAVRALQALEQEPKGEALDRALGQLRELEQRARL